jgi:hypothetical protein
MTRILIEIGAQGSLKEVDAFTDELLGKYSDYRRGLHNDGDTRSVGRYKWSDSDTVVARLKTWLPAWSEKYPIIRIYGTATDIDGGDEVRYLSYFGGVFRVGETIIQHDRHVSIFGTCDCLIKSSFYSRHPTESPFRDCPIRLNPPAEWAIKDIMNAHEMIGAR